MRKTLLFLLLLDSLALCCLSQPSSPFQDIVPQVKPISPDAAALFKVLERPIGTFTGTVPVSFPLFSLTSGELNADVSLDYNSTGGIRVEEMASSVGLGFSLADGAGRITQITRDRADDKAGFFRTSPKPAEFSCSDMYDVRLNYVSDGIDLEPDIFLYDFLGRSGKFFFKEDSSIVVMDNAGIKIDFSFASGQNAGFKQFIITDEKGSKYYFGQNKSGTVTYKTDNGYIYENSQTGTHTGEPTSTWYLTEAFDKNEENNIKFTYALSVSMVQQLSGEFMKLQTYAVDCNGFNIHESSSIISSMLYDYVVSRIDANNGYVLFSTSETRADGGGRKLDSIRLYDNANNLKKRYRFNYNYFNPNDTYGHSKRLKLLNFCDAGASGTDSLKYSFEYEENVNLPSRIGTAIDFWGFYNGNTSWTLCPNVLFDGFRRNDLANRNAQPSQAIANILKKITYPTGGYRQFVYEGNTALMNFNPNEYYIDPLYTSYQGFSETNFDGNTGTIPCFKKTFTVNSTDGGTTFYYQLNGIGALCSAGYTVKIYKTVTQNDMFDTNNKVYEMSNFSPHNTSLVNGYYRIEVYKASSGCTFSSITGDWGECTLNTSTIVTPYGEFNRDNRHAGGVRVKQINDYDPVTGKTHTTDYYYKLYSTDSTFTSGLLVSPIKMVSLAHRPGVGCQFYRLDATSNYPLANESGSYVVYPEVRTIETGNGRTDRVFSFAPDVPNIAAFPMVPLSDNSHLRGNLLSEKIYDQSGTLIRKKTNTYTSIIAGGQTGIRSKGYWYSVGTGYYYEYPYQENLAPSLASCSYYYTTAFHTALASESDTLYSSTGVVGTRKDYTYYNHNTWLAPQQIKATINNGAKKEVTYKYPFTPNGDFTFGLNTSEQSLKSTLLAKNYLQPIETVDSLKPSSGSGTFLGGNKIIFDTFNVNKYHPAKVQVYTSPTDYDELNITRYSSFGNIQEQYRTNGVKELFVWGYKGSYPIAKITGTDYSNITVFSQSDMDYPSSDFYLRSQMNKIRTKLAFSSAQVSTYSYSPLYGINSQTDPSGKTLYYTYDAFGRLALIKDQDGRVVKKICYNYQGLAGSCSLYGNVAKSGNYSRTNCGPGYIGGPVTYNVAANTHYAASQAEADAIAQSDVVANGQAYANVNGTCTAIWYNVQKSGTFTRNSGCPSGTTGGSYLYVVPAGTYSSFTSQAAADALAQNDVTNNGQSAANTYGPCNMQAYIYNGTNVSGYIVSLYKNDGTFSGQYNVNTGTQPQSIGNIPAGNYSVTIEKPGNTTDSRDFSACGNYTYGLTAYFTDVEIGPGCTTIYIN